jgi:hypothetical protein
MKLPADEAELVGKWDTGGTSVRADPTCERIAWLTEHHLRKVAASPHWGGWQTLYQDPDDGRYWERTYPQSEMQGGGPPRLAIVSVDQARARYKIN